ncbi:MAG: hypothetical protein HFI92_06400 [Lachnospiraceae bacterium]|nr:hypothetical protein [Lachnospiraceae bacterium]
MNILIDDIEYPDQAEVNGEWYEIRTNFRNSVLFELMMQDESLDTRTKVQKGLNLYYPIIPGDLDAAVNAMLWFYRCGKDETVQQKRMAARRGGKQIYSFEHDAGLIYAAFLQTYKIDLQDIAYMHWWRFRFLFNALPKDCEFMRAMEYRCVEINDKMSKDQKEFYKKMKRLYALPLSQEEDRRQTAIENALLNGGDLSGVL